MKQLLTENIKTFKRCGIALFKAECVWKLLTMAIGYPLVLLIINMTFKVSGVPYLTSEMAHRYVRHPLTITVFFLLFFVVSIYSLFEMSIISVYYDCDVKDVKRYSILKFSVKRFLSIFRLKKLPVILYGLIVLPVVSVTIMAFAIFEFPSMLFMFDITKKMKLIASIVYVVLFVIAMLNLFTICIMFHDDVSYGSALKRSVKCVFGNSLKSLFLIILWNVVITVAIALIYLLFTLLIIVGVKLLGKTQIGTALYLTAIRGLTNGLSYFLLAIYIPVTYIMIQSMYTSYCKKEKISSKDIKIEDTKPKHEKIYRVATIVITVVTVVVDVYFLRNAIFGNPFSKLNINTVPAVIAHRGSSSMAPENTMPAFERAMDDMADYIELDVKQTKDDVVIVLHDPSLKRTTGVKKDIWKVDYEELLTYDAGSWFDEAFEGTVVPTLREVLEACAGKVKLDIEIKPTGHDNNLERAVIELVEEYNMQKDVIITSMKYDVLKRVKEINPKIKTGYIMSAAYGKFYNMNCADFFCINYSFVTKNIVDLIHNNGKKIYVWTVNGKKNAEVMTRMGVDGIITDNPVKCREIAYKKYSNEKLLDILKYVFE